MTTDTAIVRVNPTVEPRVAQLAQEAEVLLRRARDVVVDSQKAVKDATDDLNMIGTLEKALEQKRKEYVGPLNEHVKSINADFKTIMEPLTQAQDMLKHKVLDYKHMQDELRRKEEEINLLRMEAAQKEMELKGELTEPVQKVKVQEASPRVDRTDFATGVVKKVWKCEVVDKTKLPLEYLEPDMVKIRKVITAGVTIPGVKAWQEDTLAVGGRQYRADAKALFEAGEHRPGQAH